MRAKVSKQMHLDEIEMSFVIDGGKFLSPFLMQGICRRMPFSLCKLLPILYFCLRFSERSFERHGLDPRPLISSKFAEDILVFMELSQISIHRVQRFESVTLILCHEVEIDEAS